MNTEIYDRPTAAYASPAPEMPRQRTITELASDALQEIHSAITNVHKTLDQHMENVHQRLSTIDARLEQIERRIG